MTNILRDRKRRVDAATEWWEGAGSSGPSAKQLLWDEMAGLSAWNWLHAAHQTTGGDGGMYEESSLTTLVSDGSPVNGSKGFGNDLPSVPNLADDPNNDDIDSMQVWYADEGVGAKYIVKDDFDKFVRIRNGGSWRIQTDPGSMSPSLSAPLHQLVCFRAYPGPKNETNGFWKQIGSGIMRYTQSAPDVDSTTVLDYFIPHLWEYIIDGAGNWEIRLDGVVDSSGAGGSLTSFSEWWIGSNGHPAEIHHFYSGFVDPSISAQDIATIRTNTALIWPASVPAFPHYQTIHEMSSKQQNNGTWDMLRDENEGDDIKVPVFGGGSGVEGDTLFEWFYMDYDDNTTFPLNNKLDEHLPFIQGRVELTGGASGSVDGIEADGEEIMDGAESFDTSLAQTAQNVVDNINGNSGTAHRAYCGNGSVVYIVKGLSGGETIVSSTTTITTTDTNVSNNGGGTEAQGGNILDRSDYEAGNSEGFPTIFTNPGNATGNTGVSVMCKITPIDSLGVVGEVIVGQWNPDNIS